jgi:hypothetical protein
MPMVRRINAAIAPTSTNNGTPAIQLDSLPPHSLKYTFQIPTRVQEFNPDMAKNPR